MSKEYTIKNATRAELYWAGEYNSHYGLTDNQLATRLDLNEPSVRRARNELVKSGVVNEGSMVVSRRNDRWVKTWLLTAY